MKKSDEKKIILKLRSELEIYLNKYFQSQSDKFSSKPNDEDDIIQHRNTRKTFGRLWRPDIENFLESICEGQSIRVKFYILYKLRDYYKLKDLGFQTDLKNMDYSEKITEKLKLMETYCRTNNIKNVRDYIPKDPKQNQTVTAFILDWVKKEGLPEEQPVSQKDKQRILKALKKAKIGSPKTKYETITKILNRAEYKRNDPIPLDSERSVPSKSFPK